jgi:hypothetical protein
MNDNKLKNTVKGNYGTKKYTLSWQNISKNENIENVKVTDAIYDIMSKLLKFKENIYKFI